MMATTKTIMDTLGNNSLFNTIGLTNVFSSLGLWIASKMDVFTLNDGFTLMIGGLSVIYISMQIYLTYLKTKKEKK